MTAYQNTDADIKQGTTEFALPARKFGMRPSEIWGFETKEIQLLVEKSNYASMHPPCLKGSNPCTLSPSGC